MDNFNFTSSFSSSFDDENNNNFSSTPFFDCKFETNSVYWQLVCLAATYLFLFLQMDIATWMEHHTYYEELCKKHCKCFYVDTNNTASILPPNPTETPSHRRRQQQQQQQIQITSPPPPAYHREQFEAAQPPLPTYDQAVTNTDQLPTFIQATS